MRKSKFRAWLKPASKMLYGKEATNNGQFVHMFKYRRSDVVLMEYTGLNDKNNKEICEGDIISFDNINYEVYKHPSGSWQAGGKLIWEWISEDGTENEWEIIGNIFENPELMRG